MTPRRKTPKLWRWSHSPAKGATVEVCERTPGGMLYARFWDPELRTQVYQSLKHRDRDRAKQYARDQADLIAQGKAPTDGHDVAYVLRLYLANRTPQKKSAKGRREDHRRAGLFTTQWGAKKVETELTVADWNELARKRASGAIDEHGKPVPRKKRRKVGPQAVAHEGRFIRAVFYWAMAWPVQGGGMLLSRNPFGAPARGVKSAFVLPKNPQPRRPVVSDARFAAVREAAEHILMEARQGEPGARLVTIGLKRHGPNKTEAPNRRYMKPSYLPEMLDLAWWTGRRRDALRTLWYSDFVRQGGEVVAIRWRATKHAEEAEVIPLAKAAREAVKRILAQRPGVGDRPVFPAPGRPDVAIAATACDKWLRLAEERAGPEVGHLAGGLWHPYRRGWNSKRQHLPVKARMRAGGWKTERVLRESYEHADDAMLLEVLEEPKTLIERSGQ